MQRTLSILSTLGLLLFSSYIWAAATPLPLEASAKEWLKHMANAVRELNYQGRSILINGDQLNTVEVIHGVIDGEPWERVIHLTGEPAEILRRGNKVSCLHPDANVNFQAFNSTTPLKKLAYNGKSFSVPSQYTVVKAGKSRVAGREAYRVDVVPKDKSRYGYQLWLDSASGLLLKSVTVDEKGQGLEVFEFVDIKIDMPIARKAFEPGAGLQWVEQSYSAPLQVEQPVNWRVEWLPEGFEMAAHEMRMVGGVKASTKVYSDGLAAFSIFLERVDQAIQAEGTQSHGATTALSRRMNKPASDYLVTVVGEIPIETAMQIAMAVKLEN